MAKDDNNGRTGGQEKSNNKGHRRNGRRPPAIASKAIIKLWPPPASEQITVKLNNALGNEVKERLDNWRDDDDGTPRHVLVKSISICNKYLLYNTDGDWQSVDQGVGSALTGRCEK